MTNVRRAAVRVLLQIDQSQATLGDAVEEARAGIDDRRDRGLLVELTAGTLRWRNELDALIEAASRRAVGSIDPGVLAALRLGAYQLRHLDRVPAHAVVHQSVEAVRAAGAPRAAGFVNAVLRALIRRGRSLRLPARPEPGAPDEAALDYLSITLSHPAWLARRWLARYGFDATEQWCRFNNHPPDITVRALDPLSAKTLLDRLRSEGSEATPAPFVRDAIRLPPGALGRLSPALRGQLTVQDEGAQLVARFAGARPGERVLDLCASPGGKTLVLARDVALDDPARRSMLVAADRRPRRVSLLTATVRHSGFAIPVVALDARGPLPFGPVFDCVLLDAPCSGLGTLRRDPDLKWTRREDDVARLAMVERRMLAAAADLVGSGGRLIYATCSGEPEENAEVIEAFLATDTRFLSAPATSFDAPRPDVVDPLGRLVTEPFRHRLDAFFAATLVRRPGT